MPRSDEQRRLLIGELAQRTGISPKTIRYYEQIGLLPPPSRATSGYRLYKNSDAERLRFIGGVKRLGFSLGEIREILALRDHGTAACSYVAQRLEHRAGQVDRQIRQLTQLKADLNRLRLRAQRLGTNTSSSNGYCHILENRPPTNG